MALLIIGAVPLPNPFEFSVTRSDLDSEATGRSETGLLQRTVVRGANSAGTAINGGAVYKITYGAKVTKAQLKTITDAIAPQTFSATFFDGTASSDTTKTFYCGDRTCKLSKYVNESLPADSYWEISFSLVQY